MQYLFRISTSALLAVAAIASAPSAMASDVNWSISVGGPIYSPPPVLYAQPQPVYVQPHPVYYVRPAPVYVEPAAVVQYGPPYYVEERHGRRYGHWKHHHHD